MGRTYYQHTNNIKTQLIKNGGMHNFVTNIFSIILIFIYLFVSGDSLY